MIVDVEFCIPNMHNGADAVYESLKKRADMRVLAFPCIGNCNRCVEKLHVICDDRRIEADSPDELLARVITYVRGLRLR